eukprot:COSAG02_NODE_1907_length_10423_cov_22.481596_6_plen_308_part_00
MACAKQRTLDDDTVPEWPSPTHGLLALEVQPGAYSVEFHASWMNETETGYMNPTAAKFWSIRADLLSPCCDVIGDVMCDLERDWDASTDGPLPADGSPELDIDLECGECECVRQNVEIHLPPQMFSNGNVEPSPSSRSHDDATVTLTLEQLVGWVAKGYEMTRVNAARQRLSWAKAAANVPAESEVILLSLDLIEKVGNAHQPHYDMIAAAEEWIRIHDREVAEDFMFPPPQPCSWEYTIGWKGSSGVVDLEVQGRTTLGELLHQKLCADVGWIDGTLFAKDIEIDGECVEWEEWNSKCADMIVTPP